MTTHVLGSVKEFFHKPREEREEATVVSGEDVVNIPQGGEGPAAEFCGVACLGEDPCDGDIDFEEGVSRVFPMEGEEV